MGRYVQLNLSLSFNGHFPGAPGLADIVLDFFLELRMTEVVATTEAIRRAKLRSSHHHQQTNTQRFTGRMPFLASNQQCQQ